ncbi:GntR family transcriptional regulator [Maritimibacter fusiformis]|uniref:GntR family transcriptional regulator n=1 Tax=Maritimibacter fusiformis TaxID=2603819 RepID=A0A5D0RFT3_9RHOB|nr:GntR family transcriptional regulator [Maritimibacter fusiformis]TYB80447.1 GntR family transcriptional regulator [Maritimibacter fusiformis]
MVRPKVEITQPKLPDHERAYRRLREMVLYGELAPGQPVTIQGLVDILGLGMTPVREAIRRLTSQGALEFKGNRRVEVPAMDLGQYRELAFARLAIEPELARRAVENLTDAHVATLEAEDRAVDDAIARGDVRGYLEHNHRFHARLYELSGAKVLLPISEMLWLRSGPSLRVMLGRHGTANLPDKHREALAAMRARDAGAVEQAIRDDIEQGIAQVTQSLDPA